MPSPRSARTRPTHRRRRGITLVELLIVVVIISILSLIAVAGFRKYTVQARVSEAHNVLGQIRTAQEAYRQSFGNYCCVGVDTPSWPARDGNRIAYDGTPPVAKKREDWLPLPNDPNDPWTALGVKVTTSVWFTYVFEAGKDAPSNPSFKDTSTKRPWFRAQAVALFSASENKRVLEVTSERGDVWDNQSQNP